MSSDAHPSWEDAVPGIDPGTPVPSWAGSTSTQVRRDGRTWPLGTAVDVEWITGGTTTDRAINSAIPPGFAACATVVLPEGAADQALHDAALLSVLGTHSGVPRWWLGYLDTGADDVVFPDARRVELYAGWGYVLVLAGPEQAATWKEPAGMFSGRLPNLVFPEDRSWLASTLWDDRWTCVGGSAALVEDLLRHPVLGPSTRRVEPGQDATPPGHTCS